MDVAAAKMIGAGLSMIAILGVGMGLGNIFATFIQSIARNPSAEPQMFKVSMIGMAFTEALGIFALVVALLILYG